MKVSEGEKEEGKLCSLFVLEREWKEDEVTWERAKKDVEWTQIETDTKSDFHPDGLKGGADVKRDFIATSLCADHGDWETYDVTEAIKEAIKDPGSFYGFGLKPYLDNKGRYYYSSEASTREDRPKLTIKYSTALVNKGFIHQAGKSFEIRYASQKVHVNVPSAAKYSVTIFDVKGVQLKQFAGINRGAFEFSASGFSQKVLLVKIKTDRNEVFHSFITIVQ